MPGTRWYESARRPADTSLAGKASSSASTSTRGATGLTQSPRPVERLAVRPQRATDRPLHVEARARGSSLDRSDRRDAFDLSQESKATEALYGIEELADRAGVSRRTVRYYVQRGLLPAPPFKGPDTVYGEEHLVRLKAIRVLQARFLPLDAKGKPQVATATFQVPADAPNLIESKSLKLYLWSFRNDGIFYERAVNRILDDLSEATKPRWMEVVGDFNIRGGIKSVIRASVGART